MSRPHDQAPPPAEEPAAPDDAPDIEEQADEQVAAAAEPVESVDQLERRQAEYDEAVAERVARIEDRVVTSRNAEIHGLFEILGSRRRLLYVNFLAGLSRGVGFFLGVTLIGGLLIGALALFIDTTTEAMGYQDVTFRSLIRKFAEKAVEAERVWEDVRSEESATPQAVPGEAPADSDATGETTDDPPDDGR